MKTMFGGKTVFYIIAVLMIIFGIAEIVTGFRHRFFGLTTSQIQLSTYLGVMLGSFYFISGVLTLFRRRWAGIIAVVLLMGDVLGRIWMVISGLYPANNFRQIIGIVVGTCLAAFFAIYIAVKFRTLN